MACGALGGSAVGFLFCMAAFTLYVPDFLEGVDLLVADGRVVAGLAFLDGI